MHMEKAATGIYTFKGLRERRFACVGKPVFKLGISFSSETRTIVDVKRG